MDDDRIGAGRRDSRSAGAGPPPGVGDRLNALRSLHVAQRGNSAARAHSPGLLSRPALAILVNARLGELRALDELARYLHRVPIASARRVG